MNTGADPDCRKVNANNRFVKDESRTVGDRGGPQLVGHILSGQSASNGRLIKHGLILLFAKMTKQTCFMRSHVQMA